MRKRVHITRYRRNKLRIIAAKAKKTSPNRTFMYKKRNKLRLLGSKAKNTSSNIHILYKRRNVCLQGTWYPVGWGVVKRFLVKILRFLVDFPQGKIGLLGGFLGSFADAVVSLACTNTKKYVINDV